MDALNDELLSAIEREVLHPDVIEMAVQRAAERLRPSLTELGAERVHVAGQIAVVERELERLTEAIMAGGELATLTEAIRSRGSTKDMLERRIAALDAPSP